MRGVEIFIGVVWIVFWTYWIAAAVRTRRGHTRWRCFAGTRVVIFAIIFVLARAGLFRGRRTTTSDPWLEAIGVAAFLVGLALAVWARRCIGSNWGTPMSEKSDAELITSGPYASIRHPIYTGIILALFGSAVALGWIWLVLAGLLSAFFVYSAFVEERNLAAAFPDAYPAYRRRTKMLVPLVF